MTIDDLHKQYATYTVEVKRLIHQDLPKILGNLAVSLFKKNFLNESFFGEKWKPSKRRNGVGTSGQRRTLTGTGDLGRSIQYVADDASVTIFSDLEYAKVHNDGGVTHPRVTPKMRRFAWAMFYKNGGSGKKASVLTEEAQKWKSIALTKEKRLTVRIDRRQFLGEHKELEDAVRNKIQENLDQLIK